MSKAKAMQAALIAVTAMMNKLNDTYGALNSQDSDFKNLKVEVDSALALPADEVAPGPVPADIVTNLARVNDHLTGMQEVCGLILSSIPAPAEPTDMRPVIERLDALGVLVAALTPALAS